MVDQISPTSDGYAWIGSSGGLWGSASNWTDSTTGANSALFVPGGNNPVRINAPTGAPYEAISGGGSAASLGLTGYLALNGQYALGNLALSSSTFSFRNTAIDTGLSLSAGSAVSASTVTASNAGIVVSGAGAGLTASAAVTLGSLVSGGRDPTITREAANLSVSAGAYLTAASVTVVAGSMSVSGAGSNATLSDTLILGAHDTGFAVFTSTGSLSVDAGATLTTRGAVSVLDGSSISVIGSGSKLMSAGLLTLSNFSTLLMSAGGFVQAAGLSASDRTITVDAVSTFEIGSVGNAAVGTITVDAGSAASMAGALILNGAVVNNGTISETAGTLTVNGRGYGSCQTHRCGVG